MNEITIKIGKKGDTKKGQGKKTKKPTGRPLRCAYCKGTGRAGVGNVERCPVCKGEGRVPHELKKKCGYCGGTGRAGVGNVERCSICHGWGYIE